MLRTGFGALGLFALVAAMAFGMYGVVFVDKPTAGSEIAVGLEATMEATEQSGEAASIGQTVTAGDVSWAVTDASREGELRTYTFPPKTVGGSYVSIEFTVENVADRPVTLTGETITLFDAEGNEFRPEPDRNSTFVEPELNILFNEKSLLQPGTTKEGKVNFEVLPNSSSFTALLKDTDPTASEGRRVDLGF